MLPVTLWAAPQPPVPQKPLNHPLTNYSASLPRSSLESLAPSNPPSSAAVPPLLPAEPGASQQPQDQTLESHSSPQLRHSRAGLGA